jgi:hypothetical protein
MAAIDLRNTTIFIHDGTTETEDGAVNLALGYTASPTRNAKSTSTLVVDGFVGILAIGQLITIGTSLQYYVIVGHTETSSVTTGITIFPALVEDAADDDVITVIANGIYAKIGEGNLTYNEKRNLTYIRDRGFIDTVKLGDEDPMDASLDFTWEFLRGTSTVPPTIEEAVKNIGQASGWTSSSTDPCEPYCVEVVICNIPPCGSDAERILLSQFRWENFDHDIKGAKVSMKGTCNVAQAAVTHSGS